MFRYHVGPNCSAGCGIFYILYNGTLDLTLNMGRGELIVIACGECERTRDIFILHGGVYGLYACIKHDISQLYSVMVSEPSH